MKYLIQIFWKDDESIIIFYSLINLISFIPLDRLLYEFLKTRTYYFIPWNILVYLSNSTIKNEVNFNAIMKWTNTFYLNNKSNLFQLIEHQIFSLLPKVNFNLISFNIKIFHIITNIFRLFLYIVIFFYSWGLNLQIHLSPLQPSEVYSWFYNIINNSYYFATSFNIILVFKH